MFWRPILLSRVYATWESIRLAQVGTQRFFAIFHRRIVLLAKLRGVSLPELMNQLGIRFSVSDPVTESLVPLFHPRRDRWKEHFAWNDDFTLMLGLTPIGRATIEAIQLNRLGLVNLRRALYAIGEHPPEPNN